VKAHYWAYYPLTSDELDKLWDDASFSFGTNVLLGMYRSSPELRTAFFDILESLKRRLWLPHHVGLEYHRNRVQVIQEQNSRVSSVLKAANGLNTALTDAVRGLKGSSEPPTALKAFTTELGKFRKAQSAVSLQDPFNGDDEILAKLTDLFIAPTTLGIASTPEELVAFYDEGKERFEREVPPGYCDMGKPEPNRYGDLVIWLQLIGEAKARAKPLILVTNDQKEDWWVRTGDTPIRLDRNSGKRCLVGQVSIAGSIPSTTS